MSKAPPNETEDQKQARLAKQNRYAREYRARHPEKTREISRRYQAAHRNDPVFKAKREAYRAAHPEKAAYYLKKKDLKRIGWTPAAYSAALSQQDGKCAICGKPETTAENGKIRALAADHDHLTGQRRALLCGRHNSLIGFAGESIEVLKEAIKYLEYWANQPVLPPEDL